MKVLFLVNIPSPYRVDFFNELGKLCDLTVLYERKVATDRNEKWMTKESENYKEVFLKGVNIGNDSAFNPELIKYFNRSIYDLFVIGGYSSPTGMFAIEYCKLKNIPFILNADGGMISEENKLKKKVKKHFIGSADAWLSTGKSTSEYLQYYGADSEKIYHYPFTSVKNDDIVSQVLTRSEKTALRIELGLEDKPTAISVGQFVDRKGFDVLIDAWASLPVSFNLILIGGGDKRGDLANQINNLKLSNVKLLDFLEPNELAKYYRASDLFVLPTREDIWGLVINEAMASGLPVVTTDKCVAGVELIENEVNGYIVSANDRREVSAKIKTLLSDRELSKSFGENSLRLIKQYTVEQMAIKHMDIFKTILFRSEYDNYYIYE